MVDALKKFDKEVLVFKDNHKRKKDNACYCIRILTSPKYTPWFWKECLLSCSENLFEVL